MPPTALAANHTQDQHVNVIGGEKIKEFCQNLTRTTNVMPVTSDVLLRSPLEVSDGDGDGHQSQAQRAEVKFQRARMQADFSVGRERFGLGERDFQRQYFHIYSHR